MIVLMLNAPNSEAGTTPDGATYVETGCGGAPCHTDKETSWAATPHSDAWPSLQGNPGAQEFCEPCHTTGAGEPPIFPATGFNTTTNLPVALQNVTCQACHGPASNHTSTMNKSLVALELNSSLCGACHYSSDGLGGEHHPTFNEWEVSGHNFSETNPPYATQPSCSNCKEAGNSIKYLETGVESDVLREADDDFPVVWSVTCAVCHDPHDVGVGTQLRLPAEELCQKCHTQGDTSPGHEPHHPQGEVRNNTAGYLDDRTGLIYMPSVYCSDCHMANNSADLPNHTFAPNPYSCVICHPTLYADNDSAQAAIDDVTSAIATEMEEAGTKVEQAEAALNQMIGNRTDENLTAWKWEYDVAFFNEHTLVSDKSDGYHNPPLAEALLDDAIMRADSVIGNLTPPAMVENVAVIVEGSGSIIVAWDANNDTDFKEYRIYVLTTSLANITAENWTANVTDQDTITYTVDDLDAGTTYFLYVTSVDENGNEITNMVTGIAATTEAAGELSMALLVGVIGIILIIIALITAIIMRRKGKAPELPIDLLEDETPAESEKPEE